MENGKQIIEFVALLKACAKTKDLIQGAKLHACILERNLHEKRPPLYLASTLIHMYAKCGMLAKAQEVLFELPIRDVVSWSALISGYAQQNQGLQALNCFDRMQSEGFSPDAVTFTCILKACGNMGSINKGIQIHEEIMYRGLLKKDVMLGNALVDMYAKCGMLAKAHQVLRGLPIQDVVSWNALITGYNQQEQCQQAIMCFEQMQREGFSPDSVTFSCILKACASIGDIDKGKQIHNEIVSMGLLENNAVLGTALVDMYAKCGVLSKAQKLLRELSIRDIISWSALIGGYAQHGHGHEALECYGEMQSEGISPNVVTYICILKACGCIRAIDKGRQIHEEIVSRGFLKKDNMLGNSLVDMYVKCGMVDKALEVLEELPNRDVVTWSSLIGGYAQCGQCCVAINCFERMLSEGLSPNVVTFVCILKACTSIGAIDKGEEIHNFIASKGWVDRDIILGTALVDMYAKCGMLVKSQEVLDELPIRNVISWNALISGYAEQVQGQEALNCFVQMQDEGLKPNETTLLCVLSACSHGGLVNEAEELFMNMMSKYGISPSSDHHTCIIVGFASIGQFDKAVCTIKEMPSCDYSAVWLPLLATCRKWGYIKLGMLVFDQTMQLDHSCSAAYALMANIFAASGMQEDAENIETMRLKYASL